MTWTSRKHRDLVRLLGEFLREHSGMTRDGKSWDRVAGDILLATPEHGKKHKDHAFIVPLMWWCGIAKRQHSMEPHTALRWFVQRYAGKLEKKEFLSDFGSGTVDSIARRLYQKAKTDGVFVFAGDRHKELEQAWFKGIQGSELYELAMEALVRWYRGSGGYTEIVYGMMCHAVAHNLPITTPDEPCSQTVAE